MLAPQGPQLRAALLRIFVWLVFPPSLHFLFQEYQCTLTLVLEIVFSQSLSLSLHIYIYMYNMRSQLSKSACSTSMDSISCRMKIFLKKFQKAPKKQNLNFTCTGNFFYSTNIMFITIYIALTLSITTYSRENLQYTMYLEGFVQVILKYYIILCKRLEHPWILVFVVVVEQILHRY